ncbi:MAG: Gfo/Idh/MocA family oxidoreductase [Clostridia bacterium]|nr:Gfo/Idh/MocA family oxidoreductase [Clostridia bacterium]
MSKQFNLAIVGLGGMGNWHRETIGRIDNLNVCGSFDIKEERQQFAIDHGITPYNSLEELLADEKVDIVLCSTPNHLHKEIVIKALRAGKNVVCEKPVTLSSKDLQEMIDVAEETKKVFVVHQNRRWDEDFLTMKKIYDDNLLGDVFKIESRVHGSRGIPGDWRQEPEFGGGMVLDWGVHILDQALLMIDSKVKTVYANFTHVTNELVDDGFTVVLTFENGIVYTLEVGTSNFINLPRWYMLGRDGTAIIYDWQKNGKVTRITDWSKNDAVPIRTAAGLTKTMAPRTADTIKDEELPIVKSDIRDFYRNVMATIEGKEEIIVKNTQVMRVMKLMEAIFDSAAKNQVIDFE